MTNVSFTNEIPEDEFVSQAAQAAIQATAAAAAAAASAADAAETLAELQVQLEDYVAKAGSTMSGLLILSGPPVVDDGAASKEYVDQEITDRIAEVGGDFLLIAGGTMTGDLFLNEDPSVDSQAANKHYVDELFSLVDLAAIEAIEEDVAALQDDVAALQLEVGYLEAFDTAADGRLDALEAFDTAADGRLDDLEVIDIGGLYPGETANGATFVHFVANRAFDIPTNAAGSHGHAIIDAAASTDFDIKKNGSSIGTINFATSANVCTFTVTATSFAIGDRLTMVCPATADADLADISIVIRGILT